MDFTMAILGESSSYWYVDSKYIVYHLLVLLVCKSYWQKKYFQRTFFEAGLLKTKKHVVLQKKFVNSQIVLVVET